MTDQHAGMSQAELDADFYGWHAEHGHSPQWAADGPYCETCGEVARTLDQHLAPEPDPEPEPELEAG